MPRQVKLETTEECLCGGGIVLTGTNLGTSDDGRPRLFMTAACERCGLSYDPEHARFAPYYNELSERFAN